MLHKFVSQTKLRMARSTFDREILSIESLERKMILEKQGSRLAKRMKGMLAKKKIVSDAQLRQDLKGILINDDELSKEASKLGMAKVPNYVILGDLTLNNHE